MNDDLREMVRVAVGEPQAPTIIERIDSEPETPQDQSEVVSYVGYLLDAGAIEADKVVAESDEGRVLRVGNLYFLDLNQGLEQIGAEAAVVAEIVGEATEGSSTSPYPETDGRGLTAMLDELEAAAGNSRDDQRGGSNV